MKTYVYKIIIICLLIFIPQIAFVDEPSIFNEIKINKPPVQIIVKQPEIKKQIIKKKIQIDIDVISQIESSNNRFAISRENARGICQLKQNAWNDANISKFGYIKYSFYLFWANAKINKELSDHYLHIVIPKQLKYYHIPKTEETVLASYNFGVKNLKRIIKKYGNNWKQHLPEETKDYLIKYDKLSND